MQINEPLLAEFKHEAANTRKMLERVPAESFAWKPHEKSMTLVRIASHLADLPLFITYVVEKEELNLAGMDFKAKPLSSTEELLKNYDENLAKGIAALQSAGNEQLMSQWKLRMGDHVIFDMPRVAALRSMVFNHMVHHRGQLSVYLRLLNVPVPGMYGPSADEM